MNPVQHVILAKVPEARNGQALQPNESQLLSKASDREHNNRSFERPPIVMTASDRDRLATLLRTASTTLDAELARSLREELGVDIICGEVSATVVVSIESMVKFVDQAVISLRWIKLVHLDDADE